MTRIALIYGLIAGAILSVMLLIATLFADSIGFDRGAIVGYTSMVAAFVLIFFGIRSYRDQVLDGTIRFWPAVRVGLLITLIASTCYVATWEFVYYRLMPDFGERYAAHVLDKARAEGATPAQLEAQERELKEFYESYRNPLVNVAFTFLEPLPVALLFTLLSAAGLSRKRREPSTNTQLASS